MKFVLGLIVGAAVGFIAASEGSMSLIRDRAKNGFIVIDDKPYRVTPAEVR